MMQELRKANNQQQESPSKVDAPAPTQESPAKPEKAKPVQEAPQILIQIPMDKFNQCKTEGDKKQFLGNYLYPFVIRKLKTDNDPNAEMNSGRVTGMILDGQKIEYILYLCGNKAAFQSIVDDAMKMIMEHDKGIKA